MYNGIKFVVSQGDFWGFSGSMTAVLTMEKPVISTMGMTNQPMSGCTSATVAGFSFGSCGYSGKARVGRGAVSSMDMTGGTGCEASTWKSNSAVECRLSAGESHDDSTT